MYLVVRNYKNLKGNQQEISSKINSSFIPAVSKIKGFVDYYCVFSGDNSLTSVSVFQDQKGANESVKLAAEWVVKNLPGAFPEKPQILAGDVFTQGQQLRKAA